MMFDVGEAAERIGIHPNSIRHEEGNLDGVLGEIAAVGIRDRDTQKTSIAAIS